MAHSNTINTRMRLYGIFITSQLFWMVMSQNNNFIRDYFLHKNIRSVVGFSCNNFDADIDLIRIMNQVDIRTITKGPYSEYNISDLLACDINKLGVFLDLRCAGHDILKIFYESSVYRMYDYAYSWLIISHDFAYAVDILNDSAFNFETDFVISSSLNGLVQLHDVYNPCKYRGGSINVTLVGAWTEENGLNITMSDKLLEKRRNFHGMRLNMGGLVGNRPSGKLLLDYLTDDSNKKDSLTKFGYSLLIHILDMFNLTSNTSEFIRWEKNDKNGPVIGNLTTLAIDFGCNPMLPTAERFSIVQVIMPAFPLRSCFFFRTMSSTKLKMNKIFRPLGNDSWYAIGATLIVIVIIFSFILKIERKRDYNESINYGNPVFVTFGLLCQQGVEKCSRKWASRIAFLHILIFSLLLYNYYGAAIVSARLYEPMDKLNDSLYALVNSKLELSAAKSLFFDFLLQNPNWEVQYLKKFWQTIPESKRFIDLDDGIQKVGKGGFAYHTDPNDAYPLIEHYFDDLMICQLTEVHLLHPLTVTYFTTKNKQFLEIAKIGYLRTWSAGLRKRQIIRWKSRTPYCNLNALSIEPITIYEIAPILILFLFGVISSFIILFIEISILYSRKIHISNRLV